MKLWKTITAAALAATLLLGGCANGTSSDETQNSAATADSAGSFFSAADTTAADTTSAEGDISPMMWKITGSQGNTLYLFGTIHAGDERNDAVMTYLQDELDSVDSLAVEFDVEAFEADTAQQAKIAMMMMYTDGTTAKDHIRADLYEKCVDYLTENNNYSPTYDYLVSGYWIMLLEQTAIGNSDLQTDNAIDTKLIDYAKAHGKSVLDIESAESQFKMTKDFPDKLIEMQIESFFEGGEEEFSQGINEMYQKWLSGDEEALSELEYGTDEEEYGKLTDEEKKLLEDYNKAMLTDRNIGMAEKADEYLKSGKSVFFAVGTGHMVSDKGVVQLMKDKGYTVERVSTH